MDSASLLSIAITFWVGVLFLVLVLSVKNRRLRATQWLSEREVPSSSGETPAATVKKMAQQSQPLAREKELWEGCGLVLDYMGEFRKYHNERLQILEECRADKVLLRVICMSSHGSKVFEGTLTPGSSHSGEKTVTRLLPENDGGFRVESRVESDFYTTSSSFNVSVYGAGDWEVDFEGLVSRALEVRSAQVAGLRRGKVRATSSSDVELSSSLRALLVEVVPPLVTEVRSFYQAWLLGFLEESVLRGHWQATKLGAARLKSLKKSALDLLDNLVSDIPGSLLCPRMGLDSAGSVTWDDGLHEACADFTVRVALLTESYGFRADIYELAGDSIRVRRRVAWSAAVLRAYSQYRRPLIEFGRANQNSSCTGRQGDYFKKDEEAARERARTLWEEA